MGTEAVKVVILNPWYLPAFKAGGPITSIKNLISSVKNIQWSIITSAFDLGDRSALDGIQSNTWTVVDGSKVYYASGSITDFISILRTEINSEECILYINGIFSFKYSILPLLLTKLLLLRPRKLILAPRGMLRSTALSQKPLKKRLFIAIFKFFRVFDNVYFHATDNTEVNDISRILKPKGADKIHLLPNLPVSVNDKIQIPYKEEGSLSLFFLGRIHPVKNVHLIPRILKSVKGKINLSFIGFVEDISYWDKIREELSTLDCIESLKTYPKGLSPNEVKLVLKTQHVLLLPTSGENFGHAIYESLADGKPVVISNQTPWLNLTSEGVGFDLSLDNLDSFSLALQNFVIMGNDEYIKCAWTCNSFAKKYFLSLDFIPNYQRLFSY